MLIPDARHGALADAATDEEHLRLYEALDALSYIVVPLATRGKLLGTISLGTGESGRRFGPSELALAHEIARRAALAIDNARLFRAAQESYAQLNTLLVSAPVGIGFWDRDLRFVRVNDALAAINRATPEDHVGRTLADVLPGLGNGSNRSTAACSRPASRSCTRSRPTMRAGLSATGGTGSRATTRSERRARR